LPTVGINAAPLLAPRTGVGRYIAGLLAGLARLSAPGFRFLPLFAGEAALAAAAGGPAARTGPLHIARRIFRGLPGGYALADAARAATLLALRPTVYHETNYAAPRFWGPVVLSVHDLSTIRFPETQEPARARHFSRALRQRARRAARVIVPTEAVAREVADVLGVERARIVVSHYGVDGRFVPAPRVVPPALAAQGVAAPYLLFVGALDPRKGLIDLIGAYDALPAAGAHALVLAGPDGLAAPLLEQRLAAKRPGRIVRLAWVPDADLPALYAGAAAVCLPSRYEGFGFPVLEAMACGAPVVASDDPALVEVAGGRALHFPRGNAEALSAQLASAIADGAELARRGPERAAAFTWEACAARHLEAYRAAAAESAGRRG